MTNGHEANLIVGLDVGTAQTTAVIGETLPNGEISIIGVANQPSRGMDKGGVNDLDSVMRSVKLALNQAATIAECDVSSVYLSISGRHIHSQNEKGMVSIDGHEVTQEDVDHVIHTARSVKIPTERQTLHVLPQDYIIDELEGIKSPVGMSGVRMEANVHMVTCSADWARNITKCVERCDVRVDSLVFSGIASAEAVLTEDEKDLGVCLVDIGAGTTDIAVYAGGSLRHCAVLPVAGNQVTSDIAKIFRTPLSHAEQIKVDFACARAALVGKEESIEVPSVGGRPARTMSRQTLAEVVEPRYQELFELVAEALRNSGFDGQVPAGIVLTGGTAQIEGAETVAEEIFGMPVRLAPPLPLKGLHQYVEEPGFATAVGLLHFGVAQLDKKVEAKASENGIGQSIRRMRNWFKEAF
ncbi:cell division protein FtsA [Ferrimonas lipolytica]|uniref:Cell division protein FtsA n=1 Tax=Ferrimonas lipolytica TaxID=2724191 RepID=A0A6H1UJZ1_9GAMM|nr:cell division protein FtsA [Ferrimonas lipolytica]QIZ78536.1 cell division protein FtsA [Ferrimonas lipolytica]